VTTSDPARGNAGAIKGVAWLLAFRLFDRLAGMLSFVILARLLLPEHFGIVTLATGVVALVEIMSSLGLDTVLVQTRRLEKDHYDTAWTIQVGVALVCALTIAGVALPAAAFLNEPRLTVILLVLGLAVAIEGLQSVKLVDFRREMRFDKEFIFLASRRAITVATTITAAFFLRNEWALAIGLLTSRSAGTVLSYVLKPYRPRFTLAKRADFLHKSMWLLVSGMVVFARARSSDFVLGKLVGMASVGAFTLANDLASMASNELVVPINRVSLADLSSLDTQRSVVERFKAITGLVAVLVSPLTVGLGACAPLLIPILFGPAWSLTVQVVEVVSVAALVAALGSNIGVPMISLGHYRFNAAIQAIGAATLLPLLIAGTYFMGAMGAAWANLAGNVVTVFIALVYAKRAFDFGVFDFLVCVWRPVLSAALMFGAVRLCAYAATSLAGQGHPLLVLTAMIVGGAFSYLLALFGLWWFSGKPDGAETRAVRLLMALFARFGKRPAPHQPAGT
jgi:O-antigen/teichoic acid export membrane protein